jgi:hypothetical protein
MNKTRSTETKEKPNNKANEEANNKTPVKERFNKEYINKLHSKYQIKKTKYAEIKKDKEALIYNNELVECTFKPKTNKSINSKFNNDNLSIYERQSYWHNKKLER